MSNGEAQTRAILLGRKERVENALQVLGCDSHPVVGEFNLPGISRPAAPQSHAQGAPFVHGLQGVERDVQKYLAEPFRITGYQGPSRRAVLCAPGLSRAIFPRLDIDRQSHAFLRAGMLDKDQRFADHLGQVHLRHRKASRACEVQNVAHDVLQGTDAADQMPGQPTQRRVRFELMGERGREERDRTERIADFMGQAKGHLADARQAAPNHRLMFQPPQLRNVFDQDQTGKMKIVRGRGANDRKPERAAAMTVGKVAPFHDGCGLPFGLARRSSMGGPFLASR